MAIMFGNFPTVDLTDAGWLCVLALQGLNRALLLASELSSAVMCCITYAVDSIK